MAVLYANDQDRHELYEALKKQRLPFAGKRTIRFDKDDDKINFLSFNICKGLEFPLVAIMGGRIVEQSRRDSDAAKLLYVAMDEPP